MRKRFIDTNIFLRYLTKDDPSKYHGLNEVYSYDVDFDAIEDIKREVP